MTNLFTFLSDWKLKYIYALVVLSCVGVGNVWATTATLTLSSSNKFGTTSGSTKNDNQGNTWTCTCSNIQNSYQTTYNGQQFGTGASPADAKFSCTIAGATISSVKATMATGAGGTFTIKVGGDTKYSGSLTTTATEYGGTSATGTGEIEIKITKGTKASYLGQIVVVYTTASCSADPSIGNASLNGSFNMTSTTSSIGVSSGTCSTGNVACDWTDYGFVWSDGANTTTPTVSNNKVQVNTTGSATSWTGSVTPSGSTTPTSWTTGHTYYVRTYGKNSKASASYYYGSAWSFTPYLVTFYKNDGGATTSTQYVQGGVSTNLTSNSFSRTGYTFNGWNTDADGTSGTGYTNGQSVSLSANLTLYAKWNANTFYVRFNKNNNDATGTMSNQTFTYDVAQNLTANAFSLTGYTFAGWATTSGGTVAHTDEKSVSNLTSTAGGTVDLYAKWTINNYTITWKVNGETWSDKGGSTNANYNTAWSSLTLPTAPDPENDGCGQKFVGWTTTENYSNATTAPTDLLNADNKSGKTAVLITDNVVFHAVFADYDE